MTATDEPTRTHTYGVEGMTCEHCVRAVIAEISLIPGVQAVQVSLFNSTATVTSEGPLGSDAVAAALAEAGYALAGTRPAAAPTAEGGVQ